MDEFTKDIIKLLIDKFFIGLLILLVGFVISKALEKFKNEQAIMKEFEMMRDKTALQHLQRQIEELYSPLLGLIQYSDIVFNIEQKKPPTNENQTAEEKQRELDDRRNYFLEEYYLPLNSQISELIRTKIYLLDTDEIPESFQQFLKHAAQFSALHKLWKDKSIRSDFIEGIEYPDAFDVDVKNSLRSLRERYNQYLKKLEIKSLQK
ncbi:MAG: hypothetical protein AAB336_11960 [Acidobacteriota bacterium]